MVLIYIAYSVQFMKVGVFTIHAQMQAHEVKSEHQRGRFPRVRAQALNKIKVAPSFLNKTI